MKKTIATLVLATLLSTTTLATHVPTDITIQNLNGTQQYIQTYTVPPTLDPDELIEPPFTYEGYAYTYSAIVKADKLLEDERLQEEVLVVKSSKKDLSDVLALLSPTIDYAEDGYEGVLSLNHTTLDTKAAGYTTKSYTISETKTYGNLPSNDMSYVQASILKDGRTLPLKAVEWQVQATAMVGGALVPSQYTAIATYSDKASYSAATGYLTTATYEGTVSKSAVDAVTYTSTYTGTEVPNSVDTSFLESLHPAWWMGGGIVVLVLVAGTIFIIRRRRQEDGLVEEGEEEQL